MDCLITSRGATRARMMAETLQGAGLPVRLTRAPAEAAAYGCGYAVAVSSLLLERSIAVLGGYHPFRVYCPGPDGSYRERSAG